MNAVVEQKQPSLLAKFAGKFGVEANKMMATLKSTAFRQRDGAEVSNEQMMALLIVADQYGLNPFTKEIYAFPDKNNGIVPVVGVDGWSRIINEHPQFDGMDFVDGPSNANDMPEWIECVIHRKDRGHATRAREYLSECKRDTGPWKSHPRRMLRHKSMIQCARLAFGFVGIHDQDEGERIIDMGAVQVVVEPAVSDLNAKIKKTAPVEEARVVEPEADNAPALTFAQVEEALRKASDIDLLDAAADLIGAVSDAGQREELTAIYRDLREKVTA